MHPAPDPNEEPKTWRWALDEQTRTIGRRYIAECRAILAEINDRATTDRPADR